MSYSGKDFLNITRYDYGFHINGIKTKKIVHIHILYDNYHLYENTELDQDLLDIIRFLLLKLSNKIEIKYRDERTK